MPSSQRSCLKNALLFLYHFLRVFLKLRIFTVQIDTSCNVRDPYKYSGGAGFEFLPIHRFSQKVSRVFLPSWIMPAQYVCYGRTASFQILPASLNKSSINLHTSLELNCTRYKTERRPSEQLIFFHDHALIIILIIITTVFYTIIRIIQNKLRYAHIARSSPLLLMRYVVTKWLYRKVQLDWFINQIISVSWVFIYAVL